MYALRAKALNGQPRNIALGHLSHAKTGGNLGSTDRLS